MAHAPKSTSLPWHPTIKNIYFQIHHIPCVVHMLLFITRHLKVLKYIIHILISCEVICGSVNVN